MVPALAVAGALQAEGAEVAFIGAGRAEAELVPQAGYELQAGDEVRIQCAERRVRLVRASTRSYFEILRQKLKWNER